MHNTMYVPIVIRFLPAVVTLNDESLVAPTEIVVKIKSPNIVTAGVEQTLPRTATLTIPSSGTLRCKLLPSDFYRNRSEYEVSYFYKGADRPFHSEQWVVPPAPLVRSSSIYTNSINSYRLPSDYFSMVDQSSLPSYYIEGDSLIFNSQPLPDQTYSFTYQPGITRSLLVKDI